MVSPPSPDSIEQAYIAEPNCIVVNNGVVMIKDAGSDGDESHLPQPDDPPLASDATIDVLQEADAVVEKRWLGKIGGYLINEGDWHDFDRNRTYTLKSFPKGYKLYTRLTGKRANPRKDSYLFGSTTDRCREFRSPEEFVLHAKWMAFGRPKDELGRPLCACCYCSKTPQELISKWLKGKVTHLPVQTNRSASGRAVAGASRRGRTASRVQEPIIIAKDYTQLNQGKGVSTWREDATDLKK